MSGCCSSIRSCGASVAGIDLARLHAAIFQAHMKVSPVRLVATILLGGQFLPAGLPLLCVQGSRGTAVDCTQQMPAQTAASTLGTGTQPAPCTNSLLCATTTTAVVVPGGTVSISVGESRFVGLGVSTFATADPQPPLPPPPQA